MSTQETPAAHCVVLAPMSGITDRTYRHICRSLGADAVTTEMTNAEGVVRQNTTTLRQLFFNEAERPVTVQLFGSDVDLMAQAAEVVAPLRPDAIDLNFGCPADKVVQKGMGAALLRDLKQYAAIIRSVTAAVTLPVTVKIRSGWTPETLVAIEAAQLAEDAGAAGITVHPRTQNMYFEGAADWDIIRQVKTAVSIPVTGCGDIWSANDAANMLQQTGCDHIMIGRASLGNPWIFQQVQAFITSGREIPKPDTHTRIAVCLEHCRLLVTDLGDFYGLDRIKKLLPWYLECIPEWKTIAAQCKGLGDAQQLLQVVTRWQKSISDGDEKSAIQHTEDSSRESATDMRQNYFS